MKGELRVLKLVTMYFVSIVVISCTKDNVPCQEITELIDQNHLVDILPLNQSSVFNDTLTKYPQLQVYRIIDDQYSIGMHCNIYYKGLKVFSDQYSFFKSKTNNSMFTLEDFIIDTVDFTLTPTLTFSNAIDIAKQNIDFSKSCIYYRLGIFDLNSGKGMETKDYKLVWKVEGKNEIPYVILDANSGQLYRSHDGEIN